MSTVVFYRSRQQKRDATNQARLRGESTIHDDFLDRGGNQTDGSRGRLTFDIIPDVVKTPREILLELLLVKLENNTITFEQLKTLIRLEHGFNLTQTTRDKILIAVQGVVGTLRNRLIAAFNL